MTTSKTSYSCFLLICVILSILVFSKNTLARYESEDITTNKDEIIEEVAEPSEEAVEEIVKEDVREYQTITVHDNGFFTIYFSSINKYVFLKPGNQIFFSAGTESFTNQPITSDEFGQIILTDKQTDYIVTGVCNDNAYKVRTGTAIDRVTYRNYINIYADTSLTRYLTSLPVGEHIRVINTVMDGKYKVVTSDWKTGYVDARYVRILEDTLPPLAESIDKNKLYPNIILLVSQHEQLLRVYRLNSTSYVLEREIIVSTGKVSEHTPNGYFYVKAKRDTWFYNPRYNAGGKYYVQFVGNYLLHSVACDINGNPLPERVAALGTKATNGCIGMPTEDARYIYNAAKPGTLLVIDNKNTDIHFLASKI